MAEDNFWFPLEYEKLRASTGTWKDEAFGAYLRLLIYQFDKGSIPSDLDELSTISPSIRKHWPVISKKFVDDGNGGLINRKMAAVRLDILNKKEINKLNGSKGGKTKANRYRGSSETVAGLDVRSSETVANKTKQNNNKKEEENTVFTIEHCLEVALKDDRFVRANKTGNEELLEFNRLLESRGEYEKNPGDYKSHFANWKKTGKKNEAVPKTGENGISVQQMKEQKARELLGNN